VSRQQTGRGDPTPHGPALGTPRPSDSIRRSSLFLLDITVGVVAFLLLRSFLVFILAPTHPARFPQLAVALGLMTAGVMLMLLLSLNASFFRVMTRRTAAQLALVAWVAALSGVVLGVAMGGDTAVRYAGYVVLGGLAFVFITTQDARIAKARAHAAAAGPDSGEQGPQTTAGRRGSGGGSGRQDQPTARKVRSRQRRGGRRR